MIIYAIPDLTGVNISIEQFGELFNHEKVVGEIHCTELLLIRTYP